MRKTKTEEKTINVIPIMESEMIVRLVGTSLLCMNNFSQKAILTMIDKQKKIKASGGREARNPIESWDGAFYRDLNGDPAIPAHNLKAALIYSAHQDKGITKVNARGGIFVMGMKDPNNLTVEGKFRPFDESKPDTVVNSGAGHTTDLRWRPKWDSWAVMARIKFDPNKISETQLLSLLFEAGRTSGLGEGRPQKSPLSWGMFAPDLDSIKLSAPKNIVGEIDAAVKRAKIKLEKKAS